MNSTNGRILIVDDNPSIHADFRKILLPATSRESQLRNATEGLFGETPTPDDADLSYELESATQGQAGLELVRQALAENPSVCDGIHGCADAARLGWDRNDGQNLGD